MFGASKEELEAARQKLAYAESEIVKALQASAANRQLAEAQARRACESEKRAYERERWRVSVWAIGA